jgi:hypothetical protein
VGYLKVSLLHDLLASMVISGVNDCFCRLNRLLNPSKTLERQWGS